MGDASGETVPCHYCGVDVDVPAEYSRFEAFTVHFESEHIRTETGALRSESAFGTGDAGD